VPILLGHSEHHLGIDQILGAPQETNPIFIGTFPVKEEARN
jgi:hypothetical protein